MTELVGLGASTLDVLMVVAKFPAAEGVYRASSSRIQGGGPVATAVAAAARLGASAAMLDSLGDDPASEQIIAEFASRGVMVDYIRRHPDCVASWSSILVRRQDGARVITYYPSNAPEVSPAGIPLDLLQHARILHVNGRHLEACLAATRFARERGVTTSFDGGAGRYREELEPLIAQCDVRIVAEDFATARAGTPNIDDALAALAADAKLAVVTCGARGSFVLSGGERFHQPAFVVDVVDTTGAGDAYHGAFLFGLLRGRDVRGAARLASAVAALNTRALGGRSALPTLAEAERFSETAATVQNS